MEYVLNRKRNKTQLPLTQEEFEHYLCERYYDQCAWYDQKAGINKRWYYYFQTLVIVLSALTTLTVAMGVYFQQFTWFRLVALTTASIVTVLASLQKIYRFQEQWIDYRNTAETLKKEKHLYDARLSGYATANCAEQLFVERIESLISRQNTLWVARVPGSDSRS